MNACASAIPNADFASGSAHILLSPPPLRKCEEGVLLSFC
jgi:hypothetical protein